MPNVFEDIYKKNNWLTGSGVGSLPKNTKGYRKFIEKFLIDHNINSVVDFGCGDWQFSKLIDWNNVKYIGYDIVRDLIKDNTEKFSNKNIKFKITPNDLNKLDSADLLITKDVLQHMTNDDVVDFIMKTKHKYKYLLIINGTNPAEKINSDIKLGDYRPIDIRMKPFNVRAKKVYGFSGPKNPKSISMFCPELKKNAGLKMCY